MEMKMFLQKLISWCCEQGKEYEEIINNDDFFVMSVIITIDGQKKKIIVRNIGESIFIGCDVCKINRHKLNSAVNICAEMNENNLVNCSIKRNENGVILEIMRFVSLKSLDMSILVIQEIEERIKKYYDGIKTLS